MVCPSSNRGVTLIGALQVLQCVMQHAKTKTCHVTSTFAARELGGGTRGGGGGEWPVYVTRGLGGVILNSDSG